MHIGVVDNAGTRDSVDNDKAVKPALIVITVTPGATI